MYHRQQNILLIVFISSSAFIHPEVACQTNSIQQQQSASSPWSSSEDSWNYWWSYSGVSGPAYWGLLNLDWYICDKGHRQSPIDIETRTLVYDPHLAPLRADNNLISGLLYNDGHAIVFGAHITQQRVGGKVFEDQQNFKLQDNNSSRRNELAAANQQRLVNPNVAEIFGPSNYSPNLNGLSESVKLSISQDEKLRVLSVGDEQFDKSTARIENSILVASGESGEVMNDESSAENLISSDESLTMNEGVQFTQAGLPYPYKFESLYLRFGKEDEEKLSGSEHLINSQAFAGEIQLFAYNSAIYKSFLEASSKPLGLLSISVLIDVLETENTTSASKHPSVSSQNAQLENLLKHLKDVQYRGNSIPIHTFNLSALLPETDYFITYDGSLTTPGCYESVTWIVLNKPLYISRANLNLLRTISADENSNTPTGTLIAGNIRPAQPVNSRPIRTNIKPTDIAKGAETCQRLWTKYEYRSSRAVT